MAAFVWFAEGHLDTYIVRILNVCAIYAVLGMSMNLINGFTGLFSLGHAGFMAVGAYATALLTMPTEVKQSIFYLTPIVKPLDVMTAPFPIALLIGGILAAVVGFLIGAPTLRLKGDYLAIATLGFAEIIRVIFTNTQSLTNGALGLKGIPAITNLWWSFGTMVLTAVILGSLINSSYGRALKAIREDEIAAESMGINLAKHKNLAFVTGAFFAGIAGGLLGNLLGTIDPKMFNFLFTFNILLIIVLGGMGSLTGSIIAAFIVTSSAEILRFLDESINLGFVVIPGKVGLRQVVFSALLMLVVLFYRQGLMGSREFGWDRLFDQDFLAKAESSAPRAAGQRRSGQMSMLKTENATMRFGGLVAVKDFNLDLDAGEIVGLIGPNGAGKTTVFNMITGVYRPHGRAHTLSESADHRTQAGCHHRGSASPAHSRISAFSKGLSVLDNVLIATHAHLRSGFYSATLKIPRYRREERDSAREVPGSPGPRGLARFLGGEGKFPSLRAAAAPGDCAGAGHRPQAPIAR